MISFYFIGKKIGVPVIIIIIIIFFEDFIICSVHG